MVSGTALGTVAFLWLGIAANAADADTSAAFPRAPFLVNDNGTIASSASVSPCVTEEEACESSSKCLACFSAIGSDDDTAGDDGSGDDGSVNDATCEFIDALACEFYGADASCAANDEYEATVGKHSDPISSSSIGGIHFLARVSDQDFVVFLN